MNEQNNSPQSLKQKLCSETATIRWAELQRFFAQGKVIQVATGLDLIEVAIFFVNDDAEKMRSLIDDKQVNAPSDDQARAWFDNDAVLWSLVVAPYVLVQEQA